MPRRRTLDPTLDVVFKLIFTSGPDSHEALRALLTAVLRPRSPFAKLTVLNPEIPRDDVLDRGVVLDILAELEDGTRLDIEMQAYKRAAFRNRALFYWAKMFGSELERGDPYAELRPAISVLFLDYVELAGERLHSTFHLLEVHDHERFTDAIELHLIELPKLADATADERAEQPDLVTWSQFFKAQSDEELEALAMTNPEVEKAKRILDRVSADPAAREIARLRELAAINLRMDLAAALQAGKAEGKAEALRAVIEGTCGLIGVALDDDRRAQVAGLGVAGLEALYAGLVRERAWPG